MGEHEREMIGFSGYKKRESLVDGYCAFGRVSEMMIIGGICVLKKRGDCSSQKKKPITTRFPHSKNINIGVIALRSLGYSLAAALSQCAGIVSSI